MANKLQVTICGRKYTLVSDESPEYIQEIGAYVDAKMQEITNNNPTLGAVPTAVITAINIADEKRKVEIIARRKVDAQNLEIARLRQELANLKKETDPFSR